MADAPCTICSIPTPDADVCPACQVANFPPPEDLPVPWWQAARMTLAPRQDGVRAMRHAGEDTP